MAADRRERLFGGIELGGTKVMCVTGYGPGQVTAVERAPTTTPEETLGWAVTQLQALEGRSGHLDAIGIASFGPLDLTPGSPNFGHLLQTPKPHWANVDVVGPIQDRFDVPVGLGSDVEGAALAEGIAGAAQNLANFVYITVGTGIGAGVVVDGVLVRGLMHTEMGHVAVSRQPGDRYKGHCPFHRDCLEGMASGPALADRWGESAERLQGDRLEQAMALEAGYLASGVRTMIYAFSPERIVIGGGVGLAPGLLSRVQRALVKSLAGYPGLPQYSEPDFVVTAGLRELAGPGGALLLAEQAYRRS